MNAAPSASSYWSRLGQLALLGAIGLVLVGLILLGNWQLNRLDAKLDLIERVESRVYSAPVAAPDQSEWLRVSRDTHEYLHVRVHGRFLHDRETLVQALTELGGGYWVLTPLLADGGEIYLINRGFIPTGDADPAGRLAGRIEGDTEITGLLRITEPDGIFLRANETGLDRWYSRDVAAIAVSRNLDNVAPYFIDADFSEVQGDLPLGGMTRLQFRNTHLFYAITWYGLALTLAVMTLWVIRLEKKSARHRGVTQQRLDSND